jgi:hypothetical protein
MLKNLQSNLWRLFLIMWVVMGTNASWGQGSENFSNIPTGSSTSYSGRSWTGTNNVIWTAANARTDQNLNGKAICTSGNGSVTSPQYSGGMGTLTFNYVRGFTSGSARTIKVFVNNNQIGSDITVSTSSDTAQSFSALVNVSGNVTLELRTSGAQIIIDDISWTAAGPSVTTSAATGITATAATINGSITTTGSAMTASFDYGTNSSTYGSSGAATPASVAAASTSTIYRALSSLSPNTQYYFRAVGTISGTATNGSQASFYTLANAPGVPLISNATINSLTVTLNSTTENANPSATTYAIKVGSTQYVTAAGTLGTTPVYQTASAWGSKVVTGLAESTTYSFTAIAQNGASVTTEGSPANGTTLTNTTPRFTVSPTSLTGFTYSQNAGPSAYQSFSLSAVYLTGAPGNITISTTSATAYEVSLSQNSGYTNSLSVPYASATLSATTIYVRLKAGLTQGNYNAQTINITGGGATTASVTVSGNVTAPAPANDLCANATTLTVNASATSGTLVGATNTSLTGGTEGTYKDVWYKFTAGCTGSHTISASGFTGDIDTYLYATSCPTAVSGYVGRGYTFDIPETFTASLTAGTTYYLRVVAADTAAESNTFSIQVASVAAIPTVSTTGTSNLVFNGITITGTATVTGCSSAITAYGIYYSTSSGFANGTGTQVTGSATTGNAFSVNVTGLTPNTVYYYKTFATNASGNGYSSTQGTFTTPAYVVNAPNATAATGTTASSFIANWDAVSNATSYELEVATTNEFNSTNTIFSDDFESGSLSNWSNSSAWTIVNGTTNTTSPLSGTRSLRINVPTGNAGSNYIYTQPTYNLATGNVTWRFLMSFPNTDPSSGNGAWYYLMSNSLNLASSVADGYVVGVNFTGSSDDIILWKATGGSANGQLIAAGIDVDQGDVYAVEVTRTPAGVWTLKTKLGNDFTNMTTAGTATNTDYTGNAYQGFVAKYSSSNANTLVKFDNISITQPLSTTIPGYNPKVISNGATISDLVTGLTENTTYYYRVRALNSTYSVTSANSNIINVTTGKNLIWNGTQWTAGATPTIIDSGSITGTYNTASNGGFSIGALTVENTGSVNVAPNTTLTVANGITNHGDETKFVVQDNGALVQNISGVTNSGNITAHKNSNALYRQDYTMWSAPTNGAQTLGQFSPNTVETRFYEYDCKNDGSGYSEAYYHVDPATATFTPAHSYLIRMPNGDSTTNYNGGTGTLVVDGKFIGTPNNGTITRALNMNASKFTSTGNPYPSPIGVSEFFAANSSAIDAGSGIYLWRKKNNGTTGSYATINNISYAFNADNGATTGGQVNDQYFNGTATSSWRIAPGQGFLVKTNASATGTPVVTFNNGMRKNAPGSGGQSFFRAGAQSVSRYWINLANAQGNISQFTVAYTDEATNGIDYGYDAYRLGESNTFAAYTIAEDKDLTIQARPEFTIADIVKTGYVAAQAGTYTLSLSNKDGLFASGQAVYVRDNEQGVTRELTTEGYTFSTQAGTFNDRFTILYTNEVLGNDNPALNNANVTVFKNNTAIVANAGNDIINSIEVYDIQGRRIYANEKVNLNNYSITNLNASHEMLIVKVSTNKGIVSKKIIF